MPHRLTKRHLPHDYHTTNDSRGRRTLPPQWASPVGTFMWGEILPGTVALTYLWLQDAETHTQPPGTHLLLTLEGEAAVKNVHTAEGEDHVTANADTAVGLHAHEHTTPPNVVPRSHPWHVVIVQLPTGADTGSAQQGLVDRWAHVCASLHDGLHRPSLTSHTLEPAPTTAESHTGAPPPTGVWAYTRTLHREAAEPLKTAMSNHQGLVHTPHDNRQKGYTLWGHHTAPEGGLQPPADQPGISPDLTAISHAVAAMAQQARAAPQWAQTIIKETAARHNPAFAHLRGRPIHPTLPALDLPAHDAWAVHILVPHNTAPKQGTRRQVSPNNSPIPHSTTTYQRQKSSSPTTRVATTTTSRPRMSAPPSPYTPSPPTVASSHRNTTRSRHGSIHYTSPRPRAKGPPTTRHHPPIAPPSIQPAGGPRHTTKTTCSHALTLDPAPSPRPPTKAP